MVTLTLKYMDRPPDSISATMVRRHVTAKNKAGFNALYEGYLQQKIQNGMNRIERNFNNNGRNSNNGRKTKKAKKSASRSPPKSIKTA
jgi:hypothetical protein